MNKKIVYNINELISANQIKSYIKDYDRIKQGKKYDKYFDNYTENYIKQMIQYFESSGEYDKSGYLNLRINGFKEHS